MTASADAATVFAFKDQAGVASFGFRCRPASCSSSAAYGGGVSPLAVPPWQSASRAHGAATFPHAANKPTIELQEMEETLAAEKRPSVSRRQESKIAPAPEIRHSFLLACVILFCNTATGINSIIGYNTNILLQSGLSDVQAHWGYVVFTLVNFLMTIGGVMLVDRKGRKFLLILGTAGIIVSLAGTGVLFRRTEKLQVDCQESFKRMVSPDQTLTLRFDPAEADKLLAAKAMLAKRSDPQPRIVWTIIYSYGDFTAATNVARSDDRAARRHQDHARKLRAC